MIDAATTALATSMRDTCPCIWTAEQKNRIIAALAPTGGVPPAGFPLRLVQVGAVWEIVAQPKPRT